MGNRQVDTLLVQRARAGDVPAFGALIRMHRDAALGVAFAIVGSIDEAEDVVQESFIAAHAKLVQLRDPAQFRSWLLTIVRRTALAWLARWAARRTGMPEEYDPGWFPGIETADDIADAVGGLPQIYRDAVLLHYGADLSCGEIADMLDLPVSTVKGRIQKSRTRLRERLGRPGRHRIPTRGTIMTGSLVDTHEHYHAFAYHPATGLVALQWYAQDNRSGVDVVDLATRYRVTRIEHATKPAFSPDGDRIAYDGVGTNGLPALHVQPIPGGAPEIAVNTRDDAWASSASWSSDGRMIAYTRFAPSSETAHREFTVHVVDLATGESRSVIGDEDDSPLDADRFPRWSPGGRRLAFIRAIHREANAPFVAGIIDLASPGGPTVRLLPRAEGVWQFLTTACWSPDGRRIVRTENGGQLPIAWSRGFVAAEHDDPSARIVVVDPASGDVVWARAEPDARGAGFASDGAHVWCATRTEIVWLDAADGAVRHRLKVAFLPGETLHNGEVDGSAVAADDRAVLFLTTRGALYRWEPGGAVAIAVDALPVDASPYPVIPRADYDFAMPDGESIRVSHRVPPVPKRPMVISATNGYTTDEWWLIEARYEWIIPRWDEEDVDPGAHDVDILVHAGRDWASRHADRPLVAFGGGGGYESLLVLLAMARPDAPFAAGIAIAPFLRIDEYRAHQWGAGIGMSAEERDRIIRERSPLAVAGRIRAPLLLIGPRIGPRVAAYERIAETVRTNGVRCDLVLLDPANPEETGLRAYFDRTTAFLDEIGAE